MIKGRGLGIEDFGAYVEVERRGRRVPLQRGARAKVWELYREYEKIRLERDFLDANTRARDYVWLGIVEQRPA